MIENVPLFILGLIIAATGLMLMYILPSNPWSTLVTLSLSLVGGSLVAKSRKT